MMSKASVDKSKKKQETEAKEVKRGYDFYGELKGKKVRVYLVNSAIDGEIVDDSVYQIKVKDVEGNVVYINKAHIVMIEPVAEEKKK